MESLPIDSIRVFHIENLLLVYYAKTSRLYFYGDSSLEELFPSMKFPVHDMRTLSANRKYIVCRSSKSTLSVWKLDLKNKYQGARFDQCKDFKQQTTKTAKFCPVIKTGSWDICESHNITSTEWNSEDSRVLLLGTSNGQFLKINVEIPRKVARIPFTANLNLTSQITAIASAPCGKGVYAVGYSTGELVLFQDTSRGFKPIHNLKSPTKYKVRNLSWHPTSKDPAHQTLSVLKGKGNMISIWSVNLGEKCSMIRHIPLPRGHTPAAGNYFLGWGPNGRITRVSDRAIVTADIRKKQEIVTVTESADTIRAMSLDNSTNKCWTCDCLGNLKLYNLTKNKSLLSTILPFSVPFSPEDVISIEQSPVVRLRAIDKTEINQITIKKSPRKNQRSLIIDERQSDIDSSDTAGIEHQSMCGSIIHGDDNSCNEELESISISDEDEYNRDKQLEILAPFPYNDTKTIAGTLSMYTPPPGSPELSSSSSYDSGFFSKDSFDSPRSLNSYSSNSSLASEKTIHSLFSDTLLKAPWNPNLISTFRPSDQTSEQFFLKEMFTSGDNVKNVLANSKREVACKHNLILDMFSRSLKPHEASFYAKGLDSDLHWDDTLSRILHTIANLTGDSPSITNSNDVLREISSAFGQEFLIAEIHTIGAIFISLGMHEYARALYRDLDYYLEAIIVSLLGELEWFSLLSQWVQYAGEYPSSHWQYLKTLYSRLLNPSTTAKTQTGEVGIGCKLSASFNDSLLVLNEPAGLLI